MFRNYVLIACRTLLKHKASALINILGLAVAFCTATLLFLSAAFEWSYDRFHADADRIYRTYFVSQAPEGIERSATMPYPLTPSLRRAYPEIEAISRYEESGGSVQYRDKQLEKEIDGVDADFLRIFSFPMRQGTPQHALTDPSGIVITEDLAHDVFGTEDPMGKTLRINANGGPQEFRVTGVLADVPENSSLQFDALIRIERLPEYPLSRTRWDNANHEVFLKLRGEAAPGEAAPGAAAMEARLRPFTATNFANTIRDLKQQGARPDERGDVFSIRLQPLRDVHFETGLIQGLGVSRMYVYTLVLIGLFVLVIAAINFINLTLARSFTRAREVGVRKTLGAGSGQLFGQFWGESLLTCGLGLVLGLALVLALRGPFNALFNARLTLEFITQPAVLGAVGGGFLLVTLLAGGYPALALTRFRTVQVLKGTSGLGTRTSGRPGLLRNALIVTQFAMACLLIISTFVVLRQLQYLRTKSLGFRQEQVISIPMSNDLTGREALERLRNRLAGNPHVISVTGTAVNIGRGLDGKGTRSIVGFMHQGREITSDWVRVDYDYLQTLGIRLLSGRDFSRQYATDSTTAVVVSTQFAKQFGTPDPVGATFQTDSGGTKYQIIGLIPDFHLYALRNEIKPIALHLQQDSDVRYLLVRAAPQGVLPLMETLRQEWRQIAPRAEFLGSFLNENTDRWYRREERLGQMFSLAAGIAIALSCTGLFAVALLSIQQRTKEIGVRKVLGASVLSLVGLLSKDFLQLVLLALVIASPLAWWAMNQWLADFPYRIAVEWWIFAATGALALAIAFLTVSVQSVKAALMNPVKSLRTE
jgi:putative ABC transport system permease protein